MTTDIERREDFKVWFRTEGSSDPWTELVAAYARMLPGQSWELSQDGITAKGVVTSYEVGKGGRWSGFIEVIKPHEVRQLGTATVFVHGN